MRLTKRPDRLSWREAVVFVGPTVPVADARRIAPASYRPPARMGDVFRAARDGARIIGLVDGYYERVPAVWHKEIAWALSHGVRVYGAASMGALRAAELDTLGMVGVGEVYRQYRDGELDDDDEVALFHGPAESGYPAVSMPMVNIRATLRAAVDAGIVDESSARRLTAAMKSMHYPDRTADSLLDAAAAAVPDPAVLVDWLSRNSVDVKRRDAEEMLRAIALVVDGPGREPARAGTPVFEPTWIWQELVLAADQPGPQPTA